MTKTERDYFATLLLNAIRAGLVDESELDAFRRRLAAAKTERGLRRVAYRWVEKTGKRILREAIFRSVHWQANREPSRN